MLAQLIRLIACENSANIANHFDSARRIVRRWRATASCAVAEQQIQTRFRSCGGSGASGSRPERAAGCIAPLW